MAQQQQEKWVTFDEEEEALSLSDFPVIADGAKDEEKTKSSPDPIEDFEFRVSVGGGLLSKAAEADMCAADEVFFQGQILPLRPSISSDSGLFSTSRCPSRSDSMDRYSSAVSSLGFESSRSNSSSSSISRSHSSNSHSSIICDPPRLSLSNNFYTHPSPTPQVRIVRRKNAGRRSISSSPPGWGILRLGVVKTPEIELYDLRSRRSGGGGMNNPKGSNGDAEHQKKVSEANDGSRSATSTHDADGKRKGVDKVEKKVQWFMGHGFGCKCSPDSVEIVSSKVVIAKKKKEEGGALKKGESMGRNRIFEWLEDLSVTKAPGS